jgi:Fe-S oxidoreductase
MKTPTAMDAYVKEIGGWTATQLQACTRCGLCADACHFYQAVGNPEYAPVWKIELLRRAYEQRFTVGGRLKILAGLEKKVTDEDLTHWAPIVFEACTLCNKCAMVCPMGIQLGPLIHNVRTGLDAAGLVPPDLAAAAAKQRDIGSPLGVTGKAWAERLEWISDEWDVKIPVDVQGADTLAVFTSIETMKFPENIAAVAKILDRAGEKWTASSKGREVVNFGFFEGDEDLTKLFLGRVFDAAKELGVKRIMISECGHAYDAFRWTAANIMEVPPGIEVTHIIRVMYDFWKAGRIRLKRGAFDGATITFHDSCKIQRRGGHIKEPRELLKWLAPQSFKEMSPCKEQALCCGGGGGVISIQEADPLRFAVFGMKIDQMKAIGAGSVTMVCSNCRLQFVEGVAHFNSTVKVRGLTEMVAEALEQ